MSKIYLIPLSKDTPDPFAPVNNEVGEKRDEVQDSIDKKIESKLKKEKPAPVSKDVKIDLENITKRIIALKVSPSNYYRLAPVEGKIYYMKRSEGDEKASLNVFDLKEKKETSLGEADVFEISADLKMR
jgi:tricorn protease